MHASGQYVLILVLRHANHNSVWARKTFVAKMFLRIGLTESKSVTRILFCVQFNLSTISYFRIRYVDKGRPFLYTHIYIYMICINIRIECECVPSWSYTQTHMHILLFLLFLFIPYSDIKYTFYTYICRLLSFKRYICVYGLYIDTYV